ncbi:MAG: hypothetical protein M1814_003485 [Vezdaea aestivalis]|nr:MAG: hypothetical protein M1814_003485 [Vezdaea aestivalis]
MPEGQLPSSRKRQRPDKDSLQPEESLLFYKKQRLDTKHIHRPSSTFWDKLSKIWLTKSALREVARRNSCLARRPATIQQQKELHRTITRSIAAKYKRESSLAQEPASDFLDRCSSSCLKDIRQFARHGGPNLQELRGYQKPIQSLIRTMSLGRSGSRNSGSQSRTRGSSSTSRTRPTANTTATEKTGTSGAYSANFQQTLIDGGVFPDGYEYPDSRSTPIPENWEDINKKLKEPRPSLSPSQFSNERFREFKRADANVTKENKAIKRVIPIIEGNIRDSRCDGGEIRFSNLESLTGDNLVPATPDIYHGARPEQLKRKIRNDLSHYIIPAKNDSHPAIPNFFLEAKGPDGSARVAKLQATYDGALGARAMEKLHSYGDDKPVYDNNATTISSTYQDGQLKMYAHHVAQPGSPGTRPEYFMNQLDSWSLTGNPRSFREGATAYRNARDWAKKQRDEVIERANRRLLEDQSKTSNLDTEECNDDSTQASESPLTDGFVLSQESRTEIPDQDASDDPESSPDPLAIEFTRPLKRANPTYDPRSKRRNTKQAGNRGPQ